MRDVDLLPLGKPNRTNALYQPEYLNNKANWLNSAVFMFDSSPSFDILFSILA